MKKIFWGIVALLMSATLFAERVSQEDAALVANNFMNVKSATTANKAPAKRMVLKKAASAEENQYYIYENANGEGWVMIAANDIVRPVLAYSNTGHFRTDNQPRNVKGWLQSYDKQIRFAEEKGYMAGEETKQEWAALRKGAKIKQATPVVAPLIQTGWDQDAPFWNLCPKKSGSNCYTGCVATAMAQVMNYHQWPKIGTGSHSIKVNNTTYSANFGATAYDWDNMLNTYGNNATEVQKTAVATLMYHCGIAVDMSYGTASEGGSGAYTIDYNGYFSSRGTMCAEKALTQFFGYNSETVTGYYRDGSSEDGMRSWTKSEWIAMLKTELDASRPIMYAGAGCDDPNDENTCYGHSFVCDGYDDANYFHFNWGWTNWCDGYYDVDAMVTNDPGSGGGNGEYNLQQDVIVGIMPPAGADVNVTWMADGVLFDQTVATRGILTLPATTPDGCANGKVFVGWTSEENYESADTAPTFVKAGTSLTADATYYAVYADAQEGAGNTTITFTPGTDQGETSVTKGSVTCTMTTMNNSSYYQIYANEDGTFTCSAGNITKIEFTCTASGTSKYGPGNVSADVGNYSYSGSKGTWTGTATSVTLSATKQVRMTTLSITAAGGTTYSNYTTSCSGASPDPVYYTIRFFNNGKLIGTSQSILKGQQPVVPTNPTPDCNDYTFVGWWTAELAADNTQAKNWITNFKATKNQDYYAIYKKTEDGDNELTDNYKKITTTGELEAGNYIVVGYYSSNYYAMLNTLKSSYYISQQQVTPISNGLATTDGGIIWKITVNGSTLSFYNAAISKYVCMLHPDDTHYNLGFTTGTDGIYFTYSVSDGSWDFISTVYSGRHLEYYGSKSDFAVYTAAGDPIYLYKQQSEIESTTYYSSALDCTITAIDEISTDSKALKVIENGQIIIIHGNDKYTIFGQKIQ